MVGTRLKRTQTHPFFLVLEIDSCGANTCTCAYCLTMMVYGACCGPLVSVTPGDGTGSTGVAEGWTVIRKGEEERGEEERREGGREGGRGREGERGRKEEGREKHSRRGRGSGGGGGGETSLKGTSHSHTGLIN